MRSIYFSLIAFTGILVSLHAIQKIHYNNFARFFQIGKQWHEGKPLFTDNGKIKMAQYLQPLRHSQTVNDTTFNDVQYIAFIEQVLQEFSVQNLPAASTSNTHYYNLLINKNNPVILKFELISTGNEVLINDIRNLDVLVQYIQTYRQKAQPKKLCP
jgi:hypothetical protein